MMEKDIYVAPIVEILEVEVEKGFALSGSNGGGGVSPIEDWY